MIGGKNYIGPHLFDGITALLVALIASLYTVPWFSAISWDNPLDIFWRFVLPTIFILAVGTIGFIICWQYIRDSQGKDSLSAQVKFSAEGSRRYGWWKKYQLIKCEDSILYIPLTLFTSMQRDKIYRIEHWPRTKIVTCIEDLDVKDLG